MNSECSIAAVLLKMLWHEFIKWRHSDFTQSCSTNLRNIDFFFLCYVPEAYSTSVNKRRLAEIKLHLSVPHPHPFCPTNLLIPVLKKSFSKTSDLSCACCPFISDLASLKLTEMSLADTGQNYLYTRKHNLHVGGRQPNWQ